MNNLVDLFHVFTYESCSLKLVPSVFMCVSVQTVISSDGFSSFTVSVSADLTRYWKHHTAQSPPERPLRVDEGGPHIDACVFTLLQFKLSKYEQPHAGNKLKYC